MGQGQELHERKAGESSHRLESKNSNATHQALNPTLLERKSQTQVEPKTMDLPQPSRNLNPKP